MKLIFEEYVEYFKLDAKDPKILDDYYWLRIFSSSKEDLAESVERVKRELSYSFGIDEKELDDPDVFKKYEIMSYQRLLMWIATSVTNRLTEYFTKNEISAEDNQHPVVVLFNMVNDLKVEIMDKKTEITIKYPKLYHYRYQELMRIGDFLGGVLDYANRITLDTTVDITFFSPR